MTRTRAMLIALVAILTAMVSGVTVVGQAGSSTPTYPYEVTLCWKMDNPDFTNMAGYDWPQTYRSTSTCPAAPSTPAEACAGAKFQQDEYNIEHAADDQHLVDIIASGMTSSADDASLSPHNYIATGWVPDPSQCVTTTPTPTPTPTPPVTEPPTPTPTEPTPTNPPRDCRENPVTCDKPPVKPGPPTVGPPPTVQAPPSRRCIDANTIKVTHQDGTVDFIQDKGVCDHEDLPPLIETGF